MSYIPFKTWGWHRHGMHLIWRYNTYYIFIIFSSQVFLSDWSEAIVVPVHKPGKTNEAPPSYHGGENGDPQASMVFREAWPFIFRTVSEQDDFPLTI